MSTPVERLKNWLSATDLDGPWRVPKDVAALIASWERDQDLLTSFLGILEYHNDNILLLEWVREAVNKPFGQDLTKYPRCKECGGPITPKAALDNPFGEDKP